MASATSSSGNNLGLAGLASGFDWRSFIDQMLVVERQPQGRVRTQQASVNNQRSAISAIVDKLGALRAKAVALQDGSVFNSRVVAITNSASNIASATVVDGALTGDFSLVIAANGAWQGATLTGNALATGTGSATLATTVADLSPAPLAANGTLTINGVGIPVSGTDTVSSVLTRINSSGAGVTARFDPSSGQFRLAHTSSSDASAISITSDADGFAAALGLDGVTAVAGQALRYSVDGGANYLTSTSRILAEGQTGWVGTTITVAAGKTGEVDLSVASNTTRIRNAITDMVDAYNQVQSYIDSQSANSTSSGGKVTAGLLAFDRTVGETASELRRTMVSAPGSGTQWIPRLDALGFTSSSTSNSLTLASGSALDDAIANNLPEVKALFSAAGNGLAVQLKATIDRYADSTSGSLSGRVANLQKQAVQMDEQLSRMERIVLQTKERLTSSFLAMEQAQSQTSQQLQFLQQRFFTNPTS